MKAIRSLTRKPVVFQTPPAPKKETPAPDFNPGDVLRLKHNVGQNWHRKLYKGEFFIFLGLHPKHAPYATQYLEVQVREGSLADREPRTRGRLPASYFELAPAGSYVPEETEEEKKARRKRMSDDLMQALIQDEIEGY